jgi:adenosylhomocysteine nucleosidase
LATSSEDEALRNAARDRGIALEKFDDPQLGKYYWLGTVGSETVIAVRPIREGAYVVMGAIGRLGSSARGIRLREATGARGIVQLGMAFGIDPDVQKPCDVLVSSWLIPYDNREVGPFLDGREGYVVDYSSASRQPARPALVDLFLRERNRGGYGFRIHVGAVLSGAARIHSRRFRDELVAGVPRGDAPVVGGEMEGVGLLAASTAADDPVWCVVKGISDFADENRDKVIEANRAPACRNAAAFVLSALVNDTKG